MTKLEQSIYDVCKKGRPKTSHTISMILGLNKEYGSRGKQIVGMTIGRMRKKGIEVITK